MTFIYLLQIQDKFDNPPEPVLPIRLGNLRVVKDLEDRLSIARNPQARELFRIIRNPHFKVSFFVEIKMFFITMMFSFSH
jgi:hypothetical protein